MPFRVPQLQLLSGIIDLPAFTVASLSLWQVVPIPMHARRGYLPKGCYVVSLHQQRLVSTRLRLTKRQQSLPRSAERAIYLRRDHVAKKMFAWSRHFRSSLPSPSDSSFINDALSGHHFLQKTIFAEQHYSPPFSTAPSEIPTSLHLPLMADSINVVTPGIEKVRSQLLKEIEALAGPIKDLDLYNNNTVLLNKAICRIPGPLPNHAPSIKPMSELTKCPGIPPLYPQQGYRLTGEYLLLRLIQTVTTDTNLAETGNFGAWVEDEAGVVSLMTLWNCHLPPEESEESSRGPFVIPPISLGEVFPPVIMIKEPFVYGSRGGCTGIWVLHWTSDLVWVHDDLPKHWRREKKADLWIEKAMAIAGSNPTKVASIKNKPEMSWLAEVLTYVVAA